MLLQMPRGRQRRHRESDHQRVRLKCLAGGNAPRQEHEHHHRCDGCRRGKQRLRQPPQRDAPAAPRENRHQTRQPQLLAASDPIEPGGEMLHQRRLDCSLTCRGRSCRVQLRWRQALQSSDVVAARNEGAAVLAGRVKPQRRVGQVRQAHREADEQDQRDQGVCSETERATCSRRRKSRLRREPACSPPQNVECSGIAPRHAADSAVPYDQCPALADR